MNHYMIVSGSDVLWLAEEVEKHMAAGWSCLGGVSVSISVYTYDGRNGETVSQVEQYAQAMVR